MVSQLLKIQTTMSKETLALIQDALAAYKADSASAKPYFEYMKELSEYLKQKENS